jgi:hypothetical protein
MKKNQSILVIHVLLLTALIGSSAMAQDDGTSTPFGRRVLETGNWLRAETLYYRSSQPLDNHSRLQLGLRPSGAIEVRTLGISTSGDSVLLSFEIPAETFDGRVDWAWETQFVRVSHHEDLYAKMRIAVKMVFLPSGSADGVWRSRLDFRWYGMTSVECNHWDIDIPFFAGKSVQAKLHEFMDRLVRDLPPIPETFIPKDPGNTSLHDIGRKVAIEGSPPPPLEILAHRAARISSKRRAVEGLEIYGTWVARVEVRPNRGTYGTGLVDFFVTFHRDYTGDCRYEIVKLSGTKLTAEEARREISDGMLVWLEKNDIVDARWQLYPDEAPYDYALHVMTSNPDKDRLLKIYAMNKDELVFEIVAALDNMVLVTVKRQT